MQFVCMVGYVALLWHFAQCKNQKGQINCWICKKLKKKNVKKIPKKWQKITKKWLKNAKKWQKFAVTLGLILYVYD